MRAKKENREREKLRGEIKGEREKRKLYGGMTIFPGHCWFHDLCLFCGPVQLNPSSCLVCHLGPSFPRPFSREGMLGHFFFFDVLVVVPLPSWPFANCMLSAPIRGMKRENCFTGRSKSERTLDHMVASPMLTLNSSIHQKPATGPYVACSQARYWCRLPLAPTSPRLPRTGSDGRGPGTPPVIRRA